MARRPCALRRAVATAEGTADGVRARLNLPSQNGHNRDPWLPSTNTPLGGLQKRGEGGGGLAQGLSRGGGGGERLLLDSRCPPREHTRHTATGGGAPESKASGPGVGLRSGKSGGRRMRGQLHCRGRRLRSLPPPEAAGCGCCGTCGCAVVARRSPGA